MTDFFIELARTDSHSKEEREVAQRLIQAARDVGADVTVDNAGDAVGGNTGNVIVRVAGNKEGAGPLLLSSHMDTVGPGKGVKPIREADRVRSDGTTVLGGDDKSGLAVIVEVLRTLRERDVPHGEIEVAFTICEEIGLLGAKHLDVSALRAKRAVILDSESPAELTTRAPSSDRFEFIVHGLEAHAGICPENGISAVRVAAEAIATIPLGRIDAETTSNVVILEGGVATNVVPNRCVVKGEVRSLDDTKLDGRVSEIRRSFQDAAARATTHFDGRVHRAWIEERAHREYSAMNIADDEPLVQLVVRAARNAGRSVKTASAGGGSDCNVLNQRGVTAVNLGTGMRDIHTINEWLDLPEFYACADIVLECVRLAAA